jgi:hypothetical protein
MSEEITRATLLAKAWPALPSLFATFGQHSIAAALSWIDETENDAISVPSVAIDALEGHRTEILDVLKERSLNGRALFLLTTLLDPRSSEVRDLGVTPWIRRAWPKRDQDSFSDEIRSKSFLLSLALSSSEENAVTLVRAAFPCVYEAAKQGKLDDKLWQYVDPYLPWHFRSWDRCARLIRGIARLFLDREWSALEFAATLQTEEQFARALDDLDRTFAGARYVKNMCQLRKDGALSLDPARAQSLARFCDSDSRYAS